MRRFETMKIGSAVVVVMMAVVAGGVVMPGAYGQAATGAGGRAKAAALVVGTYRPRKVFDAYHLRGQFVSMIQKLQKQMRQAQANKDHKQMMAIQQQMRQAQQTLIKQFTVDLDRVMPTVAKEANVKLVVSGVAYKGPGIKTRDVTALVIKHVNPSAKPRGAGTQGQGKMNGKK